MPMVSDRIWFVENTATLSSAAAISNKKPVTTGDVEMYAEMPMPNKKETRAGTKNLAIICITKS